jgi:hypothetical protein
MTGQLVYAICFKDAKGNWWPIINGMSAWEEDTRKHAETNGFTEPCYRVRRFQLVEVVDG